MVRESTSKLLGDYDDTQTLYKAFQVASERLVRELLSVNELRVHSIESRTKDRQSLAGKLSRLGKSYSAISEVTDLVGVRVITHLEDDVDAVGRLVEAEFSIDVENSIDKRQSLGADRFGYLSLHYICELSEDRLRLAEYSRFRGLKFEVQIRSILQHAWAEIEHDLGYKAGATIPVPLRRRFSRLAGLLEIADAEFMQLRDALVEYSKDVKHAIAATPQRVGLDDVSVLQFIESSAELRELEKQMAAVLNAELGEPDKRVAGYLKQVGISTIEQLSEELTRFSRVIFDEWAARVEGDYMPNLSSGIGLYHLFQVMLVAKGGGEGLSRGFQAVGLGGGVANTHTAEVIESALRKHGFE